MQEYATVLLYAIPFFVLLIAIEHFVALYKRENINHLFDVISSLSSGISNVVKDILGLSIVIISYSYMVEHWSVMTIQNHWLLYILAFIGIDFAGYWSHRFSHEINIFWNRHIIHHSSEEFNLSCALRQSVSEIFAVFTILFLPLALLGIPKEIIGIIAPLHLFAQFWYHTRLIGKMGWLEHIIVTPSHHRVHHAINPEYMDKNYGQLFIFWDKWFGTFQEEKENIAPVYGVTRAVKTWNPWIINFKHLWLLVLDFFRTNSFRDKIRIWFMPTGWRPEDVMEKYPVDYTKDIWNREKYDTEASFSCKVWCGTQLIITLLFTLYFFSRIGSMEYHEIILYGIFIFIQIFSYTSLMDGSSLAPVSETVKLIFVLFIVYSQHFDWFGIKNIAPELYYVVFAYFSISFVITFYYFFFDRPKPVSASYHSQNIAYV
ncbi:MAG: sterol desaturase family protein [Saprospiraceae bacterium]|nr:sterol desaturase family protein [Saprospiraceae bacterium]